MQIGKAATYNLKGKASPTSSLNLAFQFSVPEAGNLKYSYV